MTFICLPHLLCMILDQIGLPCLLGDSAGRHPSFSRNFKIVTKGSFSTPISYGNPISHLVEDPFLTSSLLLAQTQHEPLGRRQAVSLVCFPSGPPLPFHSTTHAHRASEFFLSGDVLDGGAVNAGRASVSAGAHVIDCQGSLCEMLGLS